MTHVETYFGYPRVFYFTSTCTLILTDKKAAQAARDSLTCLDRRRSDSSSSQGSETGDSSRNRGSKSQGSPASDSSRFLKRNRSLTQSSSSTAQRSESNVAIAEGHSRYLHGGDDIAAVGTPRNNKNADRRRNRDGSSGVSMMGGVANDIQKRPRISNSSDGAAVNHRTSMKALRPSIDSQGAKHVAMPVGTSVQMALTPGAVPQTSLTMSTFLDAALLEPWPLAQLLSARSAYAQQQQHGLSAASSSSGSSNSSTIQTLKEPPLGEDTCSAPALRNSSRLSRRSGGDASSSSPATKDASTASAAPAPAPELLCPTCGVGIALDALDDDPESKLPTASLGCDFCPETVLCTRTPQCFALHHSKYLALFQHPPPAPPPQVLLPSPADAMKNAWVSWAREEGPRAIAAAAAAAATRATSMSTEGNASSSGSGELGGTAPSPSSTTPSTTATPSSSAQGDDQTNTASRPRMARPSAPLDASTWAVRSRYGWACPHCWAEALQRSQGWESQHQQQQLRQEAGQPWSAPRPAASSRGSGSSSVGSGGSSGNGGEVTRRSSRGTSYLSNADMRDFFEESDQLLDQLVVNRHSSGQQGHSSSRATTKDSDDGDDGDGDGNDVDKDHDTRSDDKSSTSTSSKRSESDHGGSVDDSTPKAKKKKKGRPSFASLAAKAAAEVEVADAEPTSETTDEAVAPESRAAATSMLADSAVSDSSHKDCVLDHRGSVDCNVQVEANGSRINSADNIELNSIISTGDDGSSSEIDSGSKGSPSDSAAASEGGNRRIMKPVMREAISLRGPCSEAAPMDISEFSTKSTEAITLEPSSQESAAAAPPQIGNDGGSSSLPVPFGQAKPLVDISRSVPPDYPSSLQQPAIQSSGEEPNNAPCALSVSRSVEF